MTAPAWYLPLSDALATALAQGAALAEQRLSRCETAAVLFLQHLPTLNLQRPAPLMLQRHFAGLLRQPPSQLERTLAVFFDAGAFGHGLMVSGGCAIGLMDQASVDRQAYLLADGSWDFDYAARFAERETPLRHTFTSPTGVRVRVSDHQNRLLQTLQANPGDSVQAQAHAGTGKTHLLAAILDHLGAGRCLFLADTEAKLAPIRRRFPQAATSTFLALAAASVERSLGWAFAPYRSRPEYSMTTADVAQALALPEVYPYSPAQVAAICRGTVVKFCASSHGLLDLAHIPKAYQWLEEPARLLLVHHARRLWDALFQPPQAGVTLPIRSAHWIKRMALAREVIDERYSHVLIDEGHDLTAPMVQILDRSPQAVITLGDRYQNLAGVTVSHAATIRHRDMRLSLRAGTALQDLVNPLIDAYPGSLDLPFEGDRTRHTQVCPYPALGIPQRPTLILVKDHWGLWQWVTRLAHAGIHCQVVASGPDELLSLVPDAGRLFRSDVRSNRPELARYRSWDQLRRAKAADPSFARIEQWLAGQHDHRHLKPWYSLLAPAQLASSEGYRVALVRDVRNFEFPSLALADDLYAGGPLHSDRELPRQLALLYTAMTRVRDELFLPANHEELLHSLLAKRPKPLRR
ncbi:AAA family ATPase [Pseudomonas typographi]|uniref:AAA family ATPase n=1 Tax=Pseudomonas typographi TaxID=2715964 RepID=A0ABR7Z8U9_9PSED|nr:AAA family ATPase [Pseudomonas typographi]MBD1601902.1 AAA family ATPase [Pseudomonas typographi]